jgi:hypothetical protein
MRTTTARLRPRRWLLLGGGAALAVIGGLLVLDRVLEHALRIPVDAYLRERTLNLLAAKADTGLSITLPVLDLSLFRRRLELRDIRIRYDHHEGARLNRFEATVPSVLLTGLDLSDLIWHRNFRLVGIRIRAPVLREMEEGPVEPAIGPAGRHPGGPEDTLAIVLPSPDTLLYKLVAHWLPDNVRGGRIGKLVVEHATLVWRRQRGAAGAFDSTGDVTLGIEGLQLDSTQHRVFEHGTLSFATHLHVEFPRNDTILVDRGTLTVAREDTAYSIVMARLGPGDRGNTLRVTGVTRSQARNSLTIDSLSSEPHGTDAEFFRRGRTRSTRVRVTATAITVLGLRQETILQGRATPASIRIGSLDLDVLADQRLPPDPPVRHEHWPSRFAQLAWILGADSILLDEGSIRYGELRPGQPHAAEVVFDDLRATVTNASNDSTHSGARAPLLIQARGRLYGQGLLTATISVAVQRGPLAASVRGGLGPMPLSPLNRFLTPGEGIAITKGAVRQAEFAFRVAGGRATGTFAASYQDLKISVVDPVTGKQSFGAKLKSLIAGLLVRGSSRTNSHGVTAPAPIRYQLQVGDRFWGILWQALRSGIVKQISN